MAQHASPRHSRLRRKLAVLAIVAPFAALLIMALFANPGPGVIVAPLLGPWAGLAFGHAHCTVGNQLPQLSWTLLGIGIALAVALARIRSPRLQATCVVAAVLWAITWGLAAVASFVVTLG